MNNKATKNALADAAEIIYSKLDKFEKVYF